MLRNLNGSLRDTGSDKKCFCMKRNKNKGEEGEEKGI